MPYTELGSSTTGDYTYTLYYDGSESFTTPVSFKVLNHFSRKGVTSQDFDKEHYPHDITVRFFGINESLMPIFSFAGKKSFMLKIEESSELIFQGFLLPQQYYRSYSVKKLVYDVKFYDGIETLKDTVHQFSGYTTIASFLRTCLDAIGFSLPIYTRTNITSNVYIAKDYSPASLRFNLETLLENNPESNWYDLLIAFLAAWKMNIVQEDGAWWIKQHADRDATTVYKIDTSGFVTLTNDNEEATLNRFLTDSNYTYHRGFSGIERMAINNNQSASLLNSDFTKWNNARTQVDDWELESGSISPPFLFDDHQGFYFETSNTKLVQNVLRIVSGFGKVKFSLKGTIYVDGTAGFHDIAVAELIVYIRDANSRQSGFSKYYVHKPSITTELSTTRKLVKATVEIPSGHSQNVPVALETEIDLYLSPTKDFYYTIRLVDENEAETTTQNGRRRKINEVSLETTKSLIELSSEDEFNFNSSNDNGVKKRQTVHISDNLAPRKLPEFQVFDENLVWKDVYSWRDISGTGSKTFNEIIVSDFLDRFSGSRLYIRLSILKKHQPKIRTVLSFEHEGSLKKLFVTYIQAEAANKLVKLYAIEVD